MHLQAGVIAAILSCCLAQQPSRIPVLTPYALPAPVQTSLEGLAAESNVLILGELHGTQEVATISVSLLGPLTKLGYGVLAMEVQADQRQALVDWATGKTETIPPFFAQPSFDGRNSLQNLALIRSAISDHGWTLVCFDDAAPLPPGPVDFTAFAKQRDAAMATIVTRERKRLTANSKVLAICGNVHARTALSTNPKDPLKDLWPSFAAALQTTNPSWKVRSVNVVGHGGDFFAAMSLYGDDTPPVPKVHPIRSQKKIDMAEAHALDKGQWDWELNLPRVTAATYFATAPVAGAARPDP